jgi:hypothetical protein
MKSKKAWVVEMVTQLVKDAPRENAAATADTIVERLMEEGLLHIGYGNADVDIVVGKFADTFGTTKVSRQDRFAANRLVAKYGSQSVVGIVDMLAKHSTEKFTPVVNSVSQLEEKMPSVLNFLRNQQNEEVIEL